MGDGRELQIADQIKDKIKTRHVASYFKAAQREGSENRSLNFGKVVGRRSSLIVDNTCVPKQINKLSDNYNKPAAQ